MRAAVQPAAEDQAHADAGTDPDEREAVHAATVPVCPFGERCGVDVVLHHEGSAECAAQLGEHERLVPAG